MNVSAQNVSSLRQFHGVRSKCGGDWKKRGGARGGEPAEPGKHTSTRRDDKDGFSSSFSPAGRGRGGAISSACVTLRASCSGCLCFSHVCVLLLWARFPRYIAKYALSFSQYRCPDTNCSSGPSCTPQIQEVGLLWGHCLLYLCFLPLRIFSYATRSVLYTKGLYLGRQTSIYELVKFQMNLSLQTCPLSDRFLRSDQPRLISPGGLLHEQGDHSFMTTTSYVKTYSYRPVHQVCLFSLVSGSPVAGKTVFIWGICP